MVGLDVQSWISVNPGLKFSVLVCVFLPNVCLFQNLREDWSPIDQDKISDEIFINSMQAVGKFTFNFRLTYS
jgi:hypothetical protein